MEAVQTQQNILNPLHAWPNKPSYELRLAKYGQRGVAIYAPGLDKKRLDLDTILTSELSTLKGWPD